ncbi:MAG: hypothetical protein RJR37_01495 [Peptococcaceae bacterium MAG4]|nr:hypothetical protein [Peptococcaceae bacterium MAG4]
MSTSRNPGIAAGFLYGRLAGLTAGRFNGSGKKTGREFQLYGQGQNGRTEGEAIRDALMVCLNTPPGVFF